MTSQEILQSSMLDMLFENKTNSMALMTCVKIMTGA
jgi:hypothetical protein